MSNKVRLTTNYKRYKTEWLISELGNVIDDAWGKWDKGYIKDHILTSKYIALAYDENGIVGFSSAREFIFEESKIYYFEFLALKKKIQGNNVSLKLNTMIFKRLIVDALKSFKLKLEVMAISPNPRILGSFIRSADYVYPSPDENGQAPEYVWDRVKFLVDKIADPYRKLEREGSVIEGFYDNNQNLIYEPTKVPLDKDENINKYANKLLKFEKKLGREFIIYAKYNVLKLILGIIIGKY